MRSAACSACTDRDGHDVVATTYYALYALQHRGQESCGMAVNDDGVIYKRRELGLVNDVFTKDVLDTMPRGQYVHRPLPLCHHGHAPARQCAAVCDSPRKGAHGHGPQRQPDKLRRIARRVRAGGRHLPIHLRYRGHRLYHHQRAADRRQHRTGGGARNG